MKYWLLIDIGCLECKIETEAKGLFLTREAALATLTPEEREKFDFDASWSSIGGQNQLRLFEVEVRS